MQQKIEFLKENGWTDYYHPNNWIKTEWIKTKSNPSAAGLPLDVAFERCLKETGTSLKDFIKR